MTFYEREVIINYQAGFRIFRHSVMTPFCVFGSPDEERHVVDDGKEGNFHHPKPEKIFFVSKLN